MDRHFRSWWFSSLAPRRRAGETSARGLKIGDNAPFSLPESTSLMRADCKGSCMSLGIVCTRAGPVGLRAWMTRFPIFLPGDCRLEAGKIGGATAGDCKDPGPSAGGAAAMVLGLGDTTQHSARLGRGEAPGKDGNMAGMAPERVGCQRAPCIRTCL